MVETLGVLHGIGNAVFIIKYNEDYSTKLIETSLVDKILPCVRFDFKNFLNPTATLSTYFFNNLRILSLASKLIFESFCMKKCTPINVVVKAVGPRVRLMCFALKNIYQNDLRFDSHGTFYFVLTYSIKKCYD